MKTNRTLRTIAILVGLVLLLGGGVLSYAQTSGTIRGSVADPSGAVIAGATVEIQNPVSHYTEQVKTDSQGNFTFPNVPYNNYHVTASASGFAGTAQDVEVRSPVPVQMPKFTLQVGAASSAVTVEAAPDLLETNPVTHTDVDRELVRQAAARKPIVLFEFAGDSGITRNRRRLQWPVPWPRRSCVEFIFAGWPADYRPAKQGFLESDSNRRSPIHGGDRGRASG